MFVITAGFGTGEQVVEKDFECEGFNTEDSDDQIILLDAKENANVIGWIVLKEVLYIKIAEK